MAEQQQQQGPILSTKFPAPPPFYKYFTPENIERLEATRVVQSPDKGNSSSSAPTDAPKLDKASLPADLRYLVPPEPPANGKFRVFGDQYDINDPLPSLRAQGIPQLYPTPPGTPSASSASTFDYALYLRKIGASLLINFLELVGILSVNPEQAQKKLQDLRILFINAHHLINIYRPHQARESLIMKMEEQVDRARRETQDIRDAVANAEKVLSSLGDGLDLVGNTAADDTKARELEEEEKREIEIATTVWTKMDEILGESIGSK